MDTTIRRVETILAEHGATGRITELGGPVPTAAAAAERLGCEIGAIANSLIFSADGAAVLVVASGAHRVDTRRAAAALGTSGLARASARLVREATGQEIGGVAPVGHPRPLRTVVDSRLGRYGVVWAGAGDENTMFPTTLDELVAMTNGVLAEVGEDTGNVACP